MKYHPRNSGGGGDDDKFSFPTILPAAAGAGESHHHNHDFEFGSTTTTPPTPSSPADRLFSNGKLLPHSFPSQPPAPIAFHTTTTGTCAVHFSRSTSVTSNRDTSLLSSRSNSVGSSSSARTSFSDSSWASAATVAERKLFTQHAAKIAAAAAARDDDYIWNQYQTKKKPFLNPSYSSSRRWQFIAPAPAGLGPRHQNSVSRSRNQNCASRSMKAQCFEVRGGDGDEDDDIKKKNPSGGSFCSLFRRRLFRWIVSSCRGCHAMNPPSPVKDMTADT